MTIPANVSSLGRIWLAPMAGITDCPTRRIMRRFGATYAITEMVSAKGLSLAPLHTEAYRQLLHTGDDDTPLGVQLFGGEPRDFVAAIDRLVELGVNCHAIDINMGCPAPKIYKSGAGSALLADLPRAERIIKAVVRSCESFGLIVGVKARTGISEPNAALPLARIARDNGASYFVLHGRTRGAMFGGVVDEKMIEAVANAIDIPVVANGDIDSYTKAKRMIELGCYGVMVGRAAIGRPFVFRDIAAGFNGEECLRETIDDRLAVMVEHANASYDFYGGEYGIVRMRGILGMYAKGFDGAVEFRRQSSHVRTPSDVARMRDVRRALPS